MIGERSHTSAYPIPARPRRLESKSRPSWQRRWDAQPAPAGRSRVGDALARSVLVQLMLAMTFVAVAALLYLAQASQASVLDYNIAALQAERSQLNSQNAGLQATATSLRSLPRIEAAASTQLHMTTPGMSGTIWIKPVLPTLAAPPLPSYDPRSAQKESQPLAWMKRVFSFVKSSL